MKKKYSFLLLFFLFNLLSNKLIFFSINNEKINREENFYIKQIEIGKQYSAAVVNFDGRDSLYTWGDNSFGKLGLGNDYDNFEKIYTPTKVESLHDGTIKDVSLGDDHSAAIVNFGYKDHLYTWGKNDVGQLGLAGGIDEMNKPTELTLDIIGEKKDVNLGSDYSSLVIHSEGKDDLYTWGKNSSGQLGLGDKINKDTPMKVSIEENGSIKEYKINRVELGETHSLASIHFDGIDHLYTWGNNNFGQLGIGSNETHDKPIELDLPKVGEIKGISTKGSSSSLILNFDGKDHLYTWGKNNFGQLGLGDQENKNKLTEVTSLPSGELKDVAFGADHSSVVVTNNGKDQLFTWGLNKEGRLGLGENYSSYENLLEPKEVKELSGFNLKQLSFGFSNSAVILEKDGEENFYIWGSNKFGQIGLGKENSDKLIFSKPEEIFFWFQNPYVENSFELIETKPSSFVFSFYIYTNNDYVKLNEEDIKNKTYLEIEGKQYESEFSKSEILEFEKIKYTFIAKKLNSSTKYTDIKLHIGGTKSVIKNKINTAIELPPLFENPYLENSFELIKLKHNYFVFGFKINTSDDYVKLNEEDVKQDTYLEINGTKYLPEFSEIQIINEDQTKYIFKLGGLKSSTVYSNIKLYIGGTQGIENSISLEIKTKSNSILYISISVGIFVLILFIIIIIILLKYIKNKNMSNQKNIIKKNSFY